MAGTSRSVAPGSWRWIATVGLIAFLSVVATAGLRSVLADWTFLIPAVIGASTAALVALASGRFRLLFGETLAASVAAIVIVGIVTVGGPTPGGASTFFSALIESWADLLSAVPPAPMTAELRVPALLLAWLGTSVGAVLARRVPVPGLAIVGPLITLVVTVLLTAEDQTVSVVAGAIVAVGALVLALLQRPQSTTRAHHDGDLDATSNAVPDPNPPSRSRALMIAAMLAVVAVGAPLLGPELPLSAANERYDLRDEIQPPWDPLALPSPLVETKASLVAEREDEVMFTVESASPLERWSIAVMSDFDGVVWTVADPARPAENEFKPVGPDLPAPPDASFDTAGVAATVTIDGLDGPWVPVPGWPQRVEFTDAADGAVEGDVAQLRENTVTGTLAVPGGLGVGTTYDVTALVPPSVDDEAFRELVIPENDSSLELEVVPPQIRNLAADLTEGIDGGWGQISAIRDRFVDSGFYDKSEVVSPGHSYFRLSEFLSDPDAIVGYEEQYAAAATVIARVAGLQSRVVAGYLVPEDRWAGGRAEVRSGDRSAWIEVLVDGVGWVPVDVSPPRSREPNVDVATAAQNQVATPNPPPPPQLPPDVDVASDPLEPEEEVVEEEDEEDEPEDDETASAGGFGPVVWVAGGAASVLILLCAIIVGWKTLRTRRRRTTPSPSGRIVGAWNEVADRYDEASVRFERAGTPLESVRTVLASEPSARAVESDLAGLVSTIDRAAYHRDPPDEAMATGAWEHCDRIVGAIRTERPPLQRLRMRLDPRPLRRRPSLPDDLPTALSDNVPAGADDRG